MAVAWLGPVAVQAAPAMWVVRHGAAEIYLFGTLHVLTPSARWRTPAYDAAYARADSVWFEADLSGADQAAVAGILDRYGVDRQRRLTDKLTVAEVSALRRQRVDLARIDHLRPWAAALMLSVQPALQRGATTANGADMTVTRETRTQGKRLRAFETLEDQARMFASLSESAEARYLAEVIHNRTPRLHVTLGARGELEKAWLAGDLARLSPQLIGELQRDNPGLYDTLLKRRNLAWADALTREIATTSGVELVNVGALHMLGPDGLPALLRARGFDVQRVQ